ncbi:hypothetical protein AVEN_125773-1 [Araneus ventricosus]|uniref:Uncharacterized protein n=1 Tax=Araneus ventricosus TaxID=182803 RepID=A0A4Y2W101_ARAVE|nr:hypothetical protein AVEN_125773-1 [Araneus ventricosus]
MRPPVLFLGPALLVAGFRMLPPGSIAHQWSPMVEASPEPADRAAELERLRTYCSERGGSAPIRWWAHRMLPRRAGLSDRPWDFHAALSPVIAFASGSGL